MKILLSLLTTCLAAALYAQAPGEAIPQKKGEWVLMGLPGTAIHDPEITVLKTLSETAGAWLVSFPEERENAVRERLAQTPGFLSLQPNYYLQPRSVEPDDPYFIEQWNMERIQAPEAWTFTTGGQTALGEEIVVAVMDDGFDLDHPDLAQNLWVNEIELQGIAGQDDDMNGLIDDSYGWNFDNFSPNIPIRNHGTSVLGIIGAAGNNGAGVAGVNWNVKIMPITVRTIGHMIQCYEHVWKMRKKYNETGGTEGAFVVATNASLGFNQVFCSDFPAMEAILDSLGREGVLNVAATANGDWNVDQVGDIPTSCVSDYLIAVTNSSRFDEKLQEAAYGATSIDLAAPGGDPEDGVFTTRAPGDYAENFGGTSAACPHVAGAVALLHSIPSPEFALLARENPGEAALLVKEAILEGADSVFALQGLTLTGARLNLYRSALYLHGYFQPIPLPDPQQYADRRRLIRVFPNPAASGQPLQIAFGSRNLEPVTVRLFNALGQLLQQVEVEPQAFEDQIITLPTPNLMAGAYWLVMDNGISPITVRVLVF
jgi:subtilisin family serine protease